MLVLNMKPTPLPKYSELNRALNKTALKLHPSQVHGLICGLLCGNPNSTTAWEELVTGDAKSGKTHDLLQSLYDVSSQQLKDFLFELQLILPADKEDLPVRAEALTVWCQGFLTGLKLTQVPIVDREQSELTEAINDLIEVAKMNYEDVVESEEDEVAFTDLMEYVRTAVIYIYQELRELESPAQSASSSNHLH